MEIGDICIYIINIQSILRRGISINIAPKVGIFPEAEVNIHYRGCSIIDIPQGRLNINFITWLFIQLC